MENRNFLKDLTRYRVKLEKDGKSVVDLPGILCLPGLLAAPRLSVASVIAAPLLGYSVRLENPDGRTVDAEAAVKKTAETIMETAADTARTIKEEISKTWESITADDPESGEPEADSAPAEETDTAKEPVKQEESEIPTIQVDPDDSAEE